MLMDLTQEDLSGLSILLDPSQPYLWIWAVLLLTCFFGFGVFFGRRSPKRIVAFTTPDGPVHVTGKAIQEVVQRILSETEGVSRGRAKLRKKGRRFDIQVRVQLHGGIPLSRVAPQVQRRLRRVLEESLGIQSIRRIPVDTEGHSGEIGSHRYDDPESDWSEARETPARREALPAQTPPEPVPDTAPDDFSLTDDDLDFGALEEAEAEDEEKERKPDRKKE